MIGKTITYTDFNGLEKTETHYFHLSESEITQMQMSEYGAMETRMQAMVDAKDASQIMDQFYDLLKRSYGIKTQDGRFVKKENGVPVFEKFESTVAYDALFMELCTNSTSAHEFAKGILPKNYQEAIAKKEKEDKAKIIEIAKKEDVKSSDSND